MAIPQHELYTGKVIPSRFITFQPIIAVVLNGLALIDDNHPELSGGVCEGPQSNPFACS
jgi:hypothetical protein